MANGAYIQARIDTKTKKQAKGILDKLGISMSEAIVVYMKQIVLQKGIPFELKLPNRATLQAMEQLESGKGVTFDSVDELLEDLDN